MPFEPTVCGDTEKGCKPYLQLIVMSSRQSQPTELFAKNAKKVGSRAWLGSIGHRIRRWVN